ncbi:MAG TPA: tetratricopeptide repeat protein [Bacteroidales bacterium]|nr:tetratricopeptide repeat protein [Bacteroidales bacterium]HPT01157.1 tetratricopeptide repeat protein [Bacteroidales bacterium]
MAKKTDATEDKIHVVEDALTKTELFIEKNQKVITIVIVSVIAVALAVFAFRNLYLIPREKESQAQMFQAQRYFEQDSLNKALNGDGNNPGFLDIIDDFGMTKAANLSKYYVGIIYLKQGNFLEAITYLKKFKSSDEFVGSMALGGIGDAYTELGEREKALDYYLKAANNKDNDLTTPLYLMRAAWTYEDLGKFDKAVELYNRIKTDYYRSNEARDIEKYIERASSQTKK